MSVVSYAPEHSVRQMGLAVAATVTTAERVQLIGRRSRHENCDTHAVYGACATIFATKNAQKLFTHLRICSKSATTLFATWKPAKWYENQIEIRRTLKKHCAHAQKW